MEQRRQTRDNTHNHASSESREAVSGSTHPRPVGKKNRFHKTKVKKPRAQKVRMRLYPEGLLVIRLPKWLKRVAFFCKRHKLLTRIVASIIVLVLLFTLLFEVFGDYFKELQYKISPKAEALVGRSVDLYAEKLLYDSESQSYQYNEGYSPANGEVGGQIAGPKFTASFKEKASEGIQINDPKYSTSITIKPKFRLGNPSKDKNRLVYPIFGKKAAKILTVKAGSIKEDIVVDEYQKDSLSFEYELILPTGLEARLEEDGSLGIYGAENTALLGNVSAATEKDTELLEKAREKSKKTTLIFRIPAPYIKETGKKAVKRTARFELKDNILTLRAEQLKDLSYPISIDPTIYIETAAKLMRGNNETNTDFDIDNELIQKSQTTGARIDAWQSNLDFNNGNWDHGATAAGGYVYRTGGRIDPTKPSVVDQIETLQNSDSATFTMNMPTTRPAGDLYIAVMCYDGSQGDGSGGSTAGNNISTPPGWTKYAGRQGHAAYYKVGTDQGGGNESATYQFTGDSEKWGGVIMRITNFDSGDPVSGTPGVGHSTSNARPVFPATTPDSDGTLVIRAAGADNDEPSASSWVPSGHTKIASGGPTGTNDCAYVAASLDTPPASGVSTGTATLADASINDDYGSSSIAINPVSVTPGTEDSVQWAKFNTTTEAIESPNPGTGACSGWCTNSVYDLPEARRGHSAVAYNGYLYVIGGSDGTNRESTVFIAKLGANGEPQLWHPTGGSATYWYTDSGLNGGIARSYLTAVAYNNRMYVLGGQTNASPGGVTTVEYADIKPNGTLGTWSSGTALPAARHGHTTHVYNDTIYLIGGNNSGTLQNSVHYAKIDPSDGSMNSWVAAASFTTARSSLGGTFSTVLGGYVYITGGCTAVNGSGYCTTIATDTQVGSINADGSISEWHSISGLSSQRIGYSIIGWQGGLYRLGGCVQQNTSTGVCSNTLADVDYGVVNPAGEVSTVNISVDTSTSPCSDATAKSCDLPPPGDGAGEAGGMLSMTTILNGYLYVIGGCTDFDNSPPADADCATGDAITGNTAYVEINSLGELVEPSTCSGTSYGSWCVDSTNRINGTTGAMASGITVFNNRIYVIGGIDNSSDGVTDIYYNTTNANGSLSGAWSTTSFAAAGISGELAYTFAYARANPASAGSNPGNLYIFGGCGAVGTGAGCSSNYRSEVYKCNIAVAGSINGCTTTGQLQLDVELADETNQGLGLHSGTVYANYIYLIGGYSIGVSDRDTTFYAKFDNNNNVVDVDSGAVSGNDDDWIESTSLLSVGRRRGWAFGYNGHIYAIGGYDDSGGGILPFIEWAKMDVSDGSIDPYTTSTVQINQRWGLSMVVSNSYAYVIGGCDVGASPSECSSFERSVQTFQLYNNDSGAVNDFTAQSDDTFSDAATEDRWGASSAIYTDPSDNQSYIYVAGGCISATDCTSATNSTQYATISASDGTVGTWNPGGNLPFDRAWGSLEIAGSGSSYSLYYIGGQDDTATNEQSTVYYTTGISSGNPTWAAAANNLPAARTKFGSAVWNNRLYVVGGLDGSAAVSSTVYVSPQLNSGGNINSAWSSTTAFNVARTGAAVTAYANNLYLFGGFDGTNYLSDTQYTQINSDGTVDSWKYSNSLPGPMRDARAISANGYIYLVGGRSAASTCDPSVLVTPISANTTIASGNNPTGNGDWYETNTRYTGNRYGAAVSYHNGKLYTMGGGCTAPIDCSAGGSVCHYYSTLKSQPQVATYSRMIDTDTDVFPNSWLMNGVDNSIGARWAMKYRSMNDTDGVATDCGTADMTTWGQETDFGDTTLGQVELYTPKDGSGTNINCARYYYFYVSIDASKTFGYPEDVNRGPTINDLSLFFTSDPSKRLRHGKTFTGGEQQPLDTPCRQSSGQANCPLP